MRNKAVTLVGLLQVAAIITVVVSLLTSLPSVHRNVELLSHFRLQYLAISLLLWLAFIAMRKPAYSVLLVVSVALNASYVLPWYLGKMSPEAANPIKLMNANVRASNGEHGRLLELIDAESPDVIFLQEVTPEWLASLQSIQEDYPYGYAEPRHDNFGIAMFSRIPLDSVTHVDSPPLGYPTIVATLEVGGEMLTLINTHPTIPLTRSGFEARNAQLRSVAEIAKRENGAVILSGDLNTSMWSPAYAELEDATGLENARRGAGILPTWPTFMPFAMIPIDHVLVSNDIRIIGIERGRRSGSDHLSLLITFSL